MIDPEIPTGSKENNSRTQTKHSTTPLEEEIFTTEGNFEVEDEEEVWDEVEVRSYAITAPSQDT